MTTTLLRHMTARRLKCALFFSLLSFFQGIKELNVYQQSEHERPVTFFKEKQRDWLRRKRTVGLFGLAKDKKKKKISATQRMGGEQEVEQGEDQRRACS